MGYKRKRKLNAKMSAQSDDVSDSVDQLGLKARSENDIDDIKPKRIKLEKGDIDENMVSEDFPQHFSDTKLGINIKPEPSDGLTDNSDYSQDLSEFIQTEIKEEEFKPDWVEDETVPKGWKRRILPGIGVSKYNMPNLVSPDGRQFRSRQRALQTMLKMGADQTEIAEMSELLVHEGWESHPMLPEGWRFRKYVNAQKTTIQIANDKFQNFKSITSALEEISRQYDDETANRVTMFIEIQNVERRMETYSWKEDSSLPAGWKLRVAEGKKGKVFYLSTDGRMFPSRSIGLQHMIKEKYLEEEIEFMKAKLVEHEEWEIHDNLPPGWLFKQTYHGKNINMMTSEGEVVESFISAVEYMKNNEKYSPQDIENIHYVMSEKGIERRLESYKWEENSTIPEGWKMRTAESKTEKQYFLSPVGLSFPSRFVAYQHMIKENHTPADTMNMRICLKYENWQESPLLPRGWSFKETDGSHGLVFLSSKGTLFKSFIRALNYAENYNEEEIAQDDVERMKLFQEDVSIDRRILGYNWQESKTLPEGWKIRTAKGKVEKEYLLSPSGIQYPCRKMALIFLIQNKFPDHDVEMMRAALNEEGWKDEKLLPIKWKYRRVSKKEMHFLTEEGIQFKGSKLVRELITSKFSSKEVENFDMFDELESIRRRATSYIWNNSDETIPEGWKSREVYGKIRTSFFLSPDGIQFPCRRAALQNLIKYEADPEEIARMRDLLIHEGFESSEYLPENWMYKEVSSNSYQILTEDGSMFESFSATNEYMKCSGDYSFDDFQKMDAFEKEKSQERISTLSNWQEDKNMPKGWKTRIGESINGKRFFLSPNGQQFANRKACIQYLLKQKNYESSDLMKMKQYASLEGWEENPYLPDGWMFRNTKSKSKGFLLTREGDLFDSVLAAKAFILSNNDLYDPSDVDNIYKLLEETNKLRRLSEVKDVKSMKWFEDKNLPKGWKVIIGTQELMAPDGTSFVSRETALLHMIKARYSQKEIEDMICSLKLEGWESSHHLPIGWLCKEKSIRNDQGLNAYMVFISNHGKLCESNGFALEIMKSCKEYTDGQINTFEKQFVKKIPRKKVNPEIWSDDDSLPTGWKLRIAEGKTNKVFYLSPDGSQFQSRKASLVHMLKQNYSKEEIMAMKRTLILEDFEESINLPTGWLFKEAATKNSSGISVSVIIISDKGVIYESFSAVFEMMKSSTLYSDLHAQKLKIFMDEKSSIRRQKLENWNDDETLPKGWKMRKASGKVGKIFFLAPDGSQFGSRRASLRYMIKENHAQENIHFMRNTLTMEGFEVNDNLPTGWLFKENCSKNSGGISVSVIFLTESGEIYESFSSVLEMMDLNPGFDEEDILRLKIMMNEKSSQRRQIMEVWFQDKSLPDGWKLRKADGKTGKIFYLSPEGDQFPSRRAALIHMIKNEYDIRDVSIMRKTLTLEGFEANKYIPEDWMFKENSSKNNSGVSVSVVFISNQGEVFESFNSVFEMMRSSENYNEQSINKLRKLMIAKSSERRKTMETWEEDKNLPDGWRFRVAEGLQGRIFFLSPNGTQLLSRKLAFQYLAKNKDAAGILIMKNLLIKFEAWQEGELLPSGWLYKENSNNALDKGKARTLFSYQFLTSEGEFFEGTNKVIDHMNHTSLYNESNLEKFNKFVPGRQAQRRIKVENWSEDDTVPDGWKTRIGDGKEARKFFMNEEGKQFQTRKTALQYMIVKKYAAVEIGIMRQGFKSEGWEEDQNLPPKWKFKAASAESKTTLKILTDNGNVLESFKTARGYITEIHPQYVESFSLFEQDYLRKLKSG